MSDDFVSASDFLNRGRELVRVKAERDRYREALDRIEREAESYARIAEMGDPKNYAPMTVKTIMTILEAFAPNDTTRSEE